MLKSLLFFLLLDVVFDVQLNTNLLKGKQNEAIQAQQRQEPAVVHEQCRHSPPQLGKPDEGRDSPVKCPAISPSEAF